MTQPTNADMIAAVNNLTTAINGLTNLLTPTSPGPARGLSTNIRSLDSHKHRVGPGMGFGAVHVYEEN